MRKAVFLGNSHVAAFKLAYDQLAQAAPHQCAFYCAWCADIAFTEIQGLSLVPAQSRPIAREALNFLFHEVTPYVEERYLRTQAASKDVSTQLRITGGSPRIEFEEVTDVFYVAGTSPYDFRRLGEYIFPFTASLRHELLARLLDSSFALRDQILALRSTAPHIRHHFIGAPLRKWPPAPLTPSLLKVIERNRETIAELSGGYLFDNVFMPGPSVLAEDLVSTKPEFFREGRQQSEAYQALEATNEDNLHVNSAYASIVFAEFVTPTLDEPSPAR